MIGSVLPGGTLPLRSLPWQVDAAEMKLARFNRVFHRWASVVIALPLLLVIGTGVLLLLKKDVAWIQPPTQRGSTGELGITFDQVLASAKTVPEAGIEGWSDIDRLDVRPSKGVIKVRAENRWEIQIDAVTGNVLQVAYRRSDLIESIHDGSFFSDGVKYFVFLPSAIVLLVLWLTGIYLFAQPLLAKSRKKKRKAEAAKSDEAVLVEAAREEA